MIRQQPILIHCILIMLLWCFTACDTGNKETFAFRCYVTIPAGLNPVLTHNFEILQISGMDNSQLVDALPSEIRLYVEYGEPTIDFVRDAFFIASTDSTMTEIGYRINSPITNSRFLDLYPSIADIRDHIGQAFFQMTLKLNLRSAPVTDTYVRIDFSVLSRLVE